LLDEELVVHPKAKRHILTDIGLARRTEGLALIGEDGMEFPFGKPPAPSLKGEAPTARI
jgi:hypothetical protein